MLLEFHCVSKKAPSAILWELSLVVVVKFFCAVEELIKDSIQSGTEHNIIFIDWYVWNGPNISEAQTCVF
jgi:hypothetical protein